MYGVCMEYLRRKSKRKADFLARKIQERNSFKRRNPRIHLELSKSLRKFARNKRKYMRKLLSTISLTAFLFLSNLASAQTISNSADLEKFYTEYFNKKQSRDALVKSYCTDSLYQVWKVSGSDEPFVFGGCDKHKGVAIRQLPKDNQYYVSFGFWFLSIDDFRSSDGVAISVDKGKINKVNHHPEVSISTSDLNGSKWQVEIDYTKQSKEYDEYTQDTQIWHREDKSTFSYPYYLTDTIPTKFDHSKVGKTTKGQYFVKINPKWEDLYCDPIYYFNKEDGLMILGEHIYIKKDKEIPAEFFKPREFPVNGPKYSQW